MSVSTDRGDSILILYWKGGEGQASGQMSMETLCANSILLTLGIGALVLWVIGGKRLYTKKGWISPLIFSAGLLIGLVLPIRRIAAWIFFMGGRGDLPFVPMLIGVLLVVVSFRFPSQEKAGDAEVNPKE